jgi:hypothetical protein
MTAIRAQLPLLTDGIVDVQPITLDDANDMLVPWEHKLGAVNRPFRSEPFALFIDGDPICVAVSPSTVSSTAGGYQRNELVELARLCAAPGNSWVNRVMLRIWREVLGPRWDCWPVKAALSYSKNAMHSGNLYRFDGWVKIANDAGSSGGGQWSTLRTDDDVVRGSKSLWIWRYSE